MKLYNHSQAPNPRRVRIALAEKGLLDQVELVDLELGKGEHRTEPFLKKKPYATLPVLDLADGTSLTESISIIRYFEALSPETPLFGSTPQEKAVVDMWHRRVENGVLGSIGTYFHQGTDGLGDVGRYRNKDWGLHNLNLLRTSLDIVESQLNSNEYVAGTNYSIADITLLCAIDFGLNLKIVNLEDYPSLKTWYNSVTERSSAKA